MKQRRAWPNCYRCGTGVENREDQTVIRFEGEEVLFQRLPLGVCTGCGERFLTAATARKMESAMVLCRPAASPSPGSVRTLREALGLSREALASRLGVSAQSIFRWETGRSRPARSTVARLESLRKKVVEKRRAG